MTNCTACNRGESCYHSDEGQTDCSEGCCRVPVRGPVPDGIEVLSLVGTGVMGASYVMYEGVEWVAKAVPRYKLRREEHAAAAASLVGIETPELRALPGWVLSRRIPDVSHDIADRLPDGDFRLWLAKLLGFDALIGNDDRHRWNLLTAPSGNFAIDHERSNPADPVWHIKQALDGEARHHLTLGSWTKEIRDLAADHMRAWLADGTVAAVCGQEVVEALGR